MAATSRQMSYLAKHYCVKLYERLSTELPLMKEEPQGRERVYQWQVLLRHPEELAIPSTIGYSKLLPMLKEAYKKKVGKRTAKMQQGTKEKKAKKEKCAMMQDFEKFLKCLPQSEFISTKDRSGDWWYSFTYKGGIYLALYSHQTDEFIRIQRATRTMYSVDSDLQIAVKMTLGTEDGRKNVGISKVYSVTESLDEDYVYIFND